MLVECPQCQHELRDTARFCDHCGYSISQSDVPTERLLDSAVDDPLIGLVLDSRYELLANLGQGGFGTVYRARRLHLAGHVAIKLLHREYTEDKGALKRFRQEALAASKLNHINVVTIYDFGEAQGTTPAYIVMELVEGQSLRAVLQSEGRLTPKRAMTLARDICSGVGAAHRHNIIHRDLKPDNIIVVPANEDRERETVKVVDFGLAKLRDVAGASVLTQSGMLVGTPYYMSPEQCRGDLLDARSDVYSIGALLYEALAGSPPFTARSATEVIAKHLTEIPPPLPSDLAISPVIEAAIRRALQKEPTERQQNAMALSQELAGKSTDTSDDELTLRQPSVDHGNARDKRKRQSSVYIGNLPATPLTSPLVTGASQHNTAAVNVEALTVSNSREFWPLSAFGRNTKLALFYGLILFTALAATGFWLKQKWRDPSLPVTKSAVPFQNMRLSRLTSSGNARDAAVSQDSKYVAYKIDDGGKRSLWVKQVLSNTTIQLVPPSDTDYWGLTFSSDGNYIFYLKLSVRERGGSTVKDSSPQLYQISVLGGDPRKVMDNVSTPITFSPDGTQFAFVRDYANEGERALILVNTDTHNERKLASRSLPDFFGYEPSWSPDGKMIACPAGTYKEKFHMNVVGITVADGSEKAIPGEWDQVRQLAWLPNNNGLAVIAREEGTVSRQIWFVSYPDGVATRVTNDLNDYVSLSISKDASSLVTVQSEHINNLWVAANGDRRAKQITADSDDGRYGIAWTPDKRIVYSSGAGGNQDTWIIGSDGSNRKQLTNNKGINYYPCVTPDGRTVVFASSRTGPFYMWRMSIDGSDARQLVFSGQSENIPDCSPDGKWVVYAAYDSGSETLWKIPVEGGTPVQITNKYSGLPVVSPDGKLIACTYREDEKSAEVIALIPFDGGEPVKKFALPGSAPTPPLFRWMPDGKGIAYVDTNNGASNIWSQSISDAPPRQLTDLAPGVISSFAWSQDGTLLASARGSERNNVVLINLK